MIRNLPRPTFAGMAGFLALAAVSAALAQTVGDLDLGAIKARGTEQLLPIWVRLYGLFGSPMFNFKIVR